MDEPPKTLKQLEDWPNMAPHHFHEQRRFRYSVSRLVRWYRGIAPVIAFRGFGLYTGI